MGSTHQETSDSATIKYCALHHMLYITTYVTIIFFCMHVIVQLKLYLPLALSGVTPPIGYGPRILALTCWIVAGLVET